MKQLLLSILIIFTVYLGFATPSENLVASANMARLRAGQIIFQTHFGNAYTVLSPRNNELLQIITSARNSLNPNLIVETLYLYKKPEGYISGSQNWDEAQRTGVFNQLLAISTLTGVQYHSASRGEMRTFYEFSSVVDSPQTKQPVPDPVYPQPRSMSLYARQKDLTFGDNIYRYDYSASRDILIFTQENITSLNYGIVPVIGKGSLRSIFAVFDCGDTILIYAASMANALMLPGLKDRITGSFSSRAEAILKWFSGRLDSEIYK